MKTIFALMLMSVACCADVVLEPGVAYQVTKMNGDVVKAADGFAPPTMLLDDKKSRVSGTSGVNRYGGPYHYADGRLVFGNLFSTMMGGSEEAMALEQRFLAIIAKPLTLEIREGGIALTGEGGTLLLTKP